MDVQKWEEDTLLVLNKNEKKNPPLHKHTWCFICKITIVKSEVYGLLTILINSFYSCACVL